MTKICGAYVVTINYFSFGLNRSQEKSTNLIDFGAFLNNLSRKVARTSKQTVLKSLFRMVMTKLRNKMITLQKSHSANNAMAINFTSNWGTYQAFCEASGRRNNVNFLSCNCGELIEWFLLWVGCDFMVIQTRNFLDVLFVRSEMEFEA